LPRAPRWSMFSKTATTRRMKKPTPDEWRMIRCHVAGQSPRCCR
jgi:hypothetical protein